MDPAPALPVRKALIARLLVADQRLEEQTKDLAFIRKRLHSAEALVQSQAVSIRSLKRKAEHFRRRLLDQLALAPFAAVSIPPGSLVTSPEPESRSATSALRISNHRPSLQNGTTRSL